MSQSFPIYTVIEKPKAGTLTKIVQFPNKIDPGRTAIPRFQCCERGRPVTTSDGTSAQCKSCGTIAPAGWLEGS